MVQGTRQMSLLFLSPVCVPLLCIVYGHSNIQDSMHVQQPQSDFTTIQSCVDTLSEPGDECVIPRGHYHEHVIITNKHGTPDKPLIIRGNDDEYPIIDGTVQLRARGGWVRVNSGAYKVVIDEDIWQLFIDGEMMTNARWPNALWSNKTTGENHLRSLHEASWWTMG